MHLFISVANFVLECPAYAQDVFGVGTVAHGGWVRIVIYLCLQLREHGFGDGEVDARGCQDQVVVDVLDGGEIRYFIEEFDLVVAE